MGNYSLIPPGRTSLRAAFTLIEFLGTCAIVALLAAIAVPAVKNAKKRANVVRISGNLKTLNEAATRARLDGGSGAGTVGSDKVAAVAWYKTNAYISPEKEVGLSGINFVSGIWYADPYETLADFLADLTTGNPPTWNTAKLADPNKFAAFLGRFSTLSDDLILKAATALTDPTQVASVANAINALVGSPGTHDSTVINAAQLALFNAATAAGGQYAAINQPLDFSNLSLTGVALSSRNLSNTNLTGQQLSQAASIVSSNLAGINMAGFSGTGKTLYGSDFSKTVGFTGDMLNGALDIRYTNLASQNMTGWNSTGANLTGVNLSKSNVTGIQLNAISNATNTDLSYVNLTGFGGLTGGRYVETISIAYSTGLSPTIINNLPGRGVYADLRGLDMAGVNLGVPYTTYGPGLFGGPPLNVRDTNVTAAQLNSIRPNSKEVAIIADTKNMAGFNPTGLNLMRSQFYRADGTTVTSPAEFMSVIGLMPGPGTRWIDGTFPWGT